MARDTVSIQRLVPVASATEPATVGAFAGRVAKATRAAPAPRARGVGGILDTAIDVFVSRLWFCLAAATCLWLLAESADRLLAAPSSSQEPGLGFFRELIGALAVEHLATALVVLVVYGEMQGHRVSARTAILVTLKRLPAIVLYMGLTLVLFGATTTCLAAPFAMGPSCLVFVLPVIMVIWLVLAFVLAVAPAALVLERLSPLDALRRSLYLVRGSFWRWVGLKVIYSLLVAPFGALPATLEDVELRASLEAWLGIEGPAAAALWLLATALFVGIGTALSSVVMTVFYLDCRVRVEGLDLAMKLERITTARSVPSGGAARPEPAT